MLGKGVKVSDCLVALAIVLPVGLLVGAGLGYYGVGGSQRVLAIVAYAVLSSRIAAAVVKKRVRARTGTTP